MPPMRSRGRLVLSFPHRIQKVLFGNLLTNHLVHGVGEDLRIRTCHDLVVYRCLWVVMICRDQSGPCFLQVRPR